VLHVCWDVEHGGVEWVGRPGAILGLAHIPYLTRLAAHRLQRRIVEAILLPRCVENARYFDTHCPASFWHSTMHRNSLHQSPSSWWVSRKFLDRSIKAQRLEARLSLGRKALSSSLTSGRVGG
jgi:hypothetical protein